MTVYFHGSFGLNRDRMSGILDVVLKDLSIRDQEIAEGFGYNAPFTARYRSWLHKTGMIKVGYPVQLTDLGKIVYENDPKLESSVSQWFLHHELTEDPDRAEAWHFFLNEFLPAKNIFTKKDLLVGLTDKLRVHSEKHFGPNSNLNKVILRKILECYTADFALGRLKLLSVKNNKYYYNYQLKGPWKSITGLAEAYKQS